MWRISQVIAKYFYRSGHRQQVASADKKEAIADSTSVALEAGFHSGSLALQGDCSHEDAIAEIEDHLRGKRLEKGRGAGELLSVGRHGII